MFINMSCINKLWYIHAVEYYSTIKRNELLIYITTWIDLKIILLMNEDRKEVM